MDRNGQKPHWIGIEEAARYCGLSLEYYIALARAGILPGPLQPGLTIVDQEALDRALDRIGGSLATEPLQFIVIEQPPPEHPDEAEIRHQPHDSEALNLTTLVLLGLFALAALTLLRGT